MKYLKKFNNHNNYSDFTQTADFVKPNVSLCVEENEVHYNPWTYADEYLTFVALEDGTFTFTPQNNNIINYSTNGGETWTTGNSVEVSNGDKVMWKGTMTPATYYGIGTFTSTGNFDVQGNIMSLLHGDNFKGQTDLTGKSYAFYRLFRNNTKVVSAENLSLPATTLVDNCYANMFIGCTSLINAPTLPATTLVDYCYYNMFKSCTSLVTAPQLPATTLADDCYSVMFYGCTSLTTAPELPATTLADSCYFTMFGNCTSLINTPELPATTLAKSCYSSMFSDCTSLVAAPELPATTLVTSCYNNMFNGCTNLNYIKAMFTTTPSSSYTNNWVKNVASSGTFVKNSAATWNVSGVNGVPTGWTIEKTSE